MSSLFSRSFILNSITGISIARAGIVEEPGSTPATDASPEAAATDSASAAQDTYVKPETAEPAKARTNSIWARTRHFFSTGRWTDPWVALPEPPAPLPEVAPPKSGLLVDGYDISSNIGFVLWKHAVLNPKGRIHNAERLGLLTDPPSRFGSQEKILMQAHGQPVVIVTRPKDVARFGHDESFACKYFIVRRPDGSGRLYLTTSEVFRGFDGETTVFSGGLCARPGSRELVLTKTCAKDSGTSEEIRQAAHAFVIKLLGPDSGWTVETR